MRVPGTAISCITFSINIISCSWAWSSAFSVVLAVVWFRVFLGAADCSHWLGTYCLHLSFGNLKIASQQPVSGFALATSLSVMMVAALTSHLPAMEWNSAPMAPMKLSARTVSATWGNTDCESHCRLYNQREMISPGFPSLEQAACYQHGTTYWI